MTSNSGAYYLWAMGDLDTGSSTGLIVESAGIGVTVRNFSAIRGYSQGIQVKANGVTIEDVTVEAADLYGVHFDGVKSGALNNFTMKHFFLGVAVGMKDSQNVAINDSTLCPTETENGSFPLSTYCLNSSNLSGKGNKVKFNHGCSDMAGSSPKLKWVSCK